MKVCPRCQQSMNFHGLTYGCPYVRVIPVPESNGGDR